MTRTTIKSGAHHNRGGDNSSEECIVPGKDQEGIMTTTEIRIDEEIDEENVHKGPGAKRDPFKDQKMGVAV